MNPEYEKLLQMYNESAEKNENALRAIRMEMATGFEKQWEEVRKRMDESHRILCRQTASIDQTMAAYESSLAAHRKNMSVILEVIFSRTDGVEDRSTDSEHRLTVLDKRVQTLEEKAG